MILFWEHSFLRRQEVLEHGENDFTQSSQKYESHKHQHSLMACCQDHELGERNY